MHEVAKYNPLPNENLTVYLKYLRSAALRMRPLRHEHSAVGDETPSDVGLLHFLAVFQLFVVQAGGDRSSQSGQLFAFCAVRGARNARGLEVRGGSEGRQACEQGKPDKYVA